MDNQYPLIEDDDMSCADPDISYIDGAPYVTARTLARRLGYGDALFMLTLGGQCQNRLGWNPIPAKGTDETLRVDIPIPVYGAIQLIKHSHADGQEETLAWLERVLRGKR